MLKKIETGIVTATLLILFTVIPTAVESKTPQKTSPFEINMYVDIPLIGMGAIIASSALLLEDQLPQTHDAVIDKNRLNALDRTVVGNNSRAFDITGNIGTALVPSVALCLSLLSLKEYGWHGVLEDFIIIGEALALSSIFNQVIAGAFPRARPYMYDETLREEKAHNTAWDWRSFYSGHAGSCFATTTAFSYLFTVRNPGSPWIPVVWSISMASSATVAVSRVMAGEHFWSDIMVGSIVGCAWGLIIPILHQKKTYVKKGEVQVALLADRAGVVYWF